MKYILVIGDGCADLPIEALGGKTPLEAARTPNLDVLSENGEIGLAKTVPDGVPPGSDTAILSIFGNDPRACYTGRSPLEAAGCGVILRPGEISFRTNVVSLGDEPIFEDKTMLSHNGGEIEGEDSMELMRALLADETFARGAEKLRMRFKLNPSFRHIAVIRTEKDVPAQKPPHDILGQPIGGYLPSDEVSGILVALMRRAYAVMNPHPVNARRRAKGLLPANCIWSWGEGKAVVLENFEEKYHKKAAVISAVPLVTGIGALMGVPSIDVPGMTGDLNTNYAGKAQAAVKALLEDGYDMAAVHIEAPDECSHAGDLAGKLLSIERIDAQIVGPIVSALAGKADFRLLYLSDHPTLLSTRTHDGAPVPYLLYDSGKQVRSGLSFGETSAAKGNFVPEGTSLMGRLLGG